MATIGSLTFYEYNDETVLGTLYTDVTKTTPLDLTGMTVEFIYKTSNAQDDIDALTIAATILNPTAGTIMISVSDAQVDLNKKFFRIDTISGSIRKTAVFGPVTVVDL
jgi:hypothetical protein